MRVRLASAWPAPCRFPLRAIRPRTARYCSRRRARSKKSWRSASHNSTALATGFNPDTATVEERRDHALARLRIVFGKAFVVLPRFTPANAAELEQALADSAKVQGGDPFVSTTWFQRMARVREGVARLNAALSYSEALKTGEKLKLTIAQLPYDANDRWVGLPLKAGQSLPGGKLSLAVQSAAPVDVRQPLAGLLIDEWVEVVPSATETTGIAFQYDQPNAAPPQTILVAVPPEVDLPWTVWSLQQVLLETLDLAQNSRRRPRRAGRSRALPARVVFRLQHCRRYRFDRFHNDQVEGIMPSITSWMRLEPRSRDAEMNTSLQAQNLRSALAAGAAMAVRRVPGRRQRLAGDGALARGIGAADPLSFGRHCRQTPESTPRAMTAAACRSKHWSSGKRFVRRPIKRRSRKSSGWPPRRASSSCACSNSSRCRVITATHSSANIRFRH